MLKVVNTLTAINRKVMLTLAMICLILAMVLVSADAISRKFGVTVPGAVSITELLIAGLVFGGIVYAQTAGVHLYVGLLDGVLSETAILVTDLIGLLAGFISIGIMGWYGFLQAIDSWEFNEIAESAIDVPLWPSRFLLAVGCLLLCLQFILDAVRLILSREKRRAIISLDSAT
jgi:TRAP-type C4-dicarboxylate transport system permease small subunit